MQTFKDYFYLKEEKETIKSITNRIKNNEIDNIDISFKHLKSLPNWNHITVIGNFNCSGNNLTNLIGAPKNVGGNFWCYSNNLTSLEGSPKMVGGNFYCFYNKLTSLEGSPKNIGGDFYCSSNHLTSLEGAPESVDGDFECFDCPNIQEDQWQYLPRIGGELKTDKDLSQNEYLTLKRLVAIGHIGGLDLKGEIEQFEEDDPFNI